MVDDDEPSDLEKVVRKSIDLVLCDRDDCVMIGEYWPCYTMEHKKCRLYDTNVYKG